MPLSLFVCIGSKTSLCRLRLSVGWDRIWGMTRMPLSLAIYIGNRTSLSLFICTGSRISLWLLSLKVDQVRIRGMTLLPGLLSGHI